MEIFPKKYQFPNDSIAKQLLAYLTEHEAELNLTSAIAFCEFPLFREDEDILTSKLLIISPHHGLVVFGTPPDGAPGDSEFVSSAIAQTDAVLSHVYSKLLRSPKLRRDRTTLLFATEVAFYAPDTKDVPPDELATPLLTSEGAVHEFVDAMKRPQPLSQELLGEITSIVEGSKGLIRPRERRVSTFGPESKVALVKALEEEIRRFDRDQRIGCITEILGPQRITGLAGSGKTVVLAMKAALTHLRDPEATIAFTFYTKSLYQHVKQLITRFYRQYDDSDPDWERLKVVHAWGWPDQRRALLSRGKSHW